MLAALGPGLRKLELCSNDLTDAVAPALGACVMNNKASLEYLGVEGNEFSSVGAKLVRAPRPPAPSFVADVEPK